MKSFKQLLNENQKIVIKKPWGVEIKDYKSGDPIPADTKFKIFDAKDTAKIDAYADSLDESVVNEATMSDIPHEIDDQIHKLKDMRFDLEETLKNWELAGMDVTPLANVINGVNNLIDTMYKNGAQLADQEIVKESVITEGRHDFPASEMKRLLDNSKYNWRSRGSAEDCVLWETKIKDKYVRIAHDDYSKLNYTGYDTVFLYDGNQKKEEKDFATFKDAFKYAEKLLDKIYNE